MVWESDSENIVRGLVEYRREKCYNGFTLFCAAHSNVFYLLDMEGNVIHTWQRGQYRQLGEILPNGNLVTGPMEVDWNGKVVWRYPCSFHHDFSVMPNGHIMLLCREKKFNRPDIFEGSGLPGLSYENDYFIELEPKTWKIFWVWSADEHIEELKKAGVRFPRPVDERSKHLRGAVFHCNTCEVLPETSLAKEDSRFKAGNVVFSYRQIDTVGVIDKDDGEIVWAWGPGVLDGQHQPTLIPDFHPITGETMPGAGHFLIFDNGRYLRDFSRVVEMDPTSEKIVWSYTIPQYNFHSWHVSGAERLPNGNTLMCDGPQGRFIEVTVHGEIVWEYLNPFAPPTKETSLPDKKSARTPSAAPAALFSDMPPPGTRDTKYGVYRCVRYGSEYIEGLLRKYE